MVKEKRCSEASGIFFFNRRMEIGGMCFLSNNHWEKYKISEEEIIYFGALANGSGALFIPPSVITHENILHLV